MPGLEGTWLEVLSLLPVRAFVCAQGGREISVGGADWVSAFVCDCRCVCVLVGGG